MRQWALLVVAVAAVVGGCGGSSDDTQPPKRDAAPRGGTLRIAVSDPGGKYPTLDPVKLDFGPAETELFRCCLLRTLVNYHGATTEDGGAVLRPDLATELPRVADDGLTYTFRLKSGVRYAPPYDDVTIKAQDIVRAIEYTLQGAGPYLASSFLPIEGAQDFRAGKAGRVSGLETPDDRTLVIHLTERVGDLSERFSLANTAPIPPGAALGHGTLGRVPVASGPYMVAGSEGFDFSRAPTARRLPSGYVLDKRITLVRNPAWRNDPLRADHVDRIVLSLEPSPAAAAAKVDDARLDLAIGQLVPTDEQVRRYSSDPELRKRLFTHVANGVRYIALNVAVPPFDDVHVRKAANLAIDKQALQRAAGSGLGGRIADHIAPDAMLDNLLLDYEPYGTPGHRGDLDAAKDEMRKSRYDRDHDGVCDAPACRHVLAPVRNDDPSIPRLGRVARASLRPIGIDLDVKEIGADAYFEKISRPNAKLPVVPALGIAPDTLNAASVFPSLAYGPLIGTPSAVNVSLVGASPRRLRQWGYGVHEVPNVDDKIRECLRLTARAQTQCWAETDQLLMEEVVPIVPYLFDGVAQVVSRRVARFTFAQSSIFEMPAFDQIALKPGSD